MRYCVNDECGHFVGTGNRAEFLDHVDQCSDCGAALVAQQPPVSPVDADAALVALESFRTVHDAALARSRLEAGGIQSWLKDEHINNVLPWLTTAVGGVKLLVDERDLIEARNALRGDATAIA